MCNQNSCNNNIVTLVISAIAGIGIAAIFSFGIISNITVALWIGFGLSALSLLTLYTILAFSRTNTTQHLNQCICSYGRNLIAGTIGTLVTTLATLSLTVDNSSTAFIIIFFLIGLFLSLLIISITQILWCFVTRNCCERFSYHNCN